MAYTDMGAEEVKEAMAGIAARCKGDDAIRRLAAEELGYEGQMFFRVASLGRGQIGQAMVRMARNDRKPVRKDGVWIVIKMDGPDGDELVF